MNETWVCCYIAFESVVSPPQTGNLPQTSSNSLKEASLPYKRNQVK